MTHSTDSPLLSSFSSLQTDDGDSGNASPNDCDIFDFDSISADDLLHVEADLLSIDSSTCLFQDENNFPYSPFVFNAQNSGKPYNSPDDGYSSVSYSTDCITSPRSVDPSDNAHLLSNQSVNNDVSINNVGPGTVMGSSLLTAVPVVNASNPTVCKPALYAQWSTQEANLKIVTRFDSDDRKYTAQELRKMRNRESARASKEKQKNFIGGLQKSIKDQEKTINYLLKQCQEKDSLIEILQEQNKNLMLSLAQHQAKIKALETQKNDISNAIIQPAKQSYPINKVASVCPNTIVPMPKTKLCMFVSSPSKRVCLAALFCFFMINFGINNVRQEAATLTGKSVTSRRLLQVNNDDIPRDSSFNQDGSLYGSWDPLHFLNSNRRKARNLKNDNENIAYDQLKISELTDNATIPSEECKNHYTNASNSNRIVKQLTQVIEYHQKLTTKSKTKATLNSKKDPSLELQELFKKTSNPALLKAMYNMLKSWERKDDTVYMFAFGSNEWFLPTSKQAANSHDTKLLRPKMSLVMPALNNTELNLDTSSIKEAFKNGNDLSSLLGFYLMQIDCLVVDTHLLTYNNSNSDQKIKANETLNSFNDSIIQRKSLMFDHPRKSKT